MSCKSCTTGGCGTLGSGEEKVSGCKNNGACSTGGCNKMNVFDWLGNMEAPSIGRFDVVEVKFKGGRKEYFRNTQELELYAGDLVVCDMVAGYHVGTVSLQGELVRLQMLRKNILNNDTLKPIQRKANEKDLQKHEQAIVRDMPTLYRTREVIGEQKLGMKLSDVEFQSDGTKATFYYSAEDRVDFRELLKTLASEFRVRVEMKQISLRQEAARVGGIGVCGRELCCSTWLTDFKNVATSAARYQNLSLNPTKLSGQCGRLKCCLNYELETYMEALRDIPAVETALQTQKGKATLQKTDIFRKIMWFSYDTDHNWYSVSISQVKQIMELNAKGILPISLEELAEVAQEKSTGKPSLNSDLDRFDSKNKRGKSRNKAPQKASENSVVRVENQQNTPNSQSRPYTKPAEGQVKKSQAPRPQAHTPAKPPVQNTEAGQIKTGNQPIAQQAKPLQPSESRNRPNNRKNNNDRRNRPNNNSNNTPKI